MQKKKKLVVLCGISGAGKSTWINEHEDVFGESYRVISRDKVRFSIVREDEDYFSHEKQVFNEFIKQIKWSLKNVETTIVDATHITEGSRRKLLTNLNYSLKDCEIIAVVLQTSVSVALERNSHREGRALVPEDVIIGMKKSFIYPKLEEGFDSIIYTPYNQKKGEKYRIITSSERAVI